MHAPTSTKTDSCQVDLQVMKESFFKIERDVCVWCRKFGFRGGKIIYRSWHARLPVAMICHHASPTCQLAARCCEISIQSPPCMGQQRRRMVYMYMLPPSPNKCTSRIMVKISMLVINYIYTPIEM
jgi:hypothetical protein